MWHRRGSSGGGGGEVGGDVDAASSCYDKSGGAAEGSVFSYGVVMVKYVCRGFTELVRAHKQTHHLGHKTSFLRVENMWIIGAKKWTDCAQKRRYAAHKWKSGTR